MINLNLLRIFHSVAQKQNVVKAASELYISQPAVSNAIKKLQKEYHIDLFQKEGRNIRLTKEGEILYSYSQKIFQLSDEAEKILCEFSVQNKKPLRVGLVTLYERFYIEEILNLLSQIVPTVPIVIVPGNSSTLGEKLENYEVDIIFNGRFIQNDNIRTKFFRRHRVCLVVPTTHNLFGKKIFTPLDIINNEFILKEKGSAVRLAVDEYFYKNNININTKVELANLDSIHELAITGNYLTFFPEINFTSFYPTWNKDCFLIDSNDDLYFSIYISCLNYNRYSLSLQEIIQKCFEQL